MEFFSEVDARLAALRNLLGDDVDTAGVPARIGAASVEIAHDILVTTASLIRQLTLVQSCAAGALAAYSTRDAGQQGFAQTRGHNTPVSLVQEITGSTRAGAAKQIRVGGALLTTVVPPAGSDDPESGRPMLDVDPAPTPWHAPLEEAALAGRISEEQHDAISCGLGEPAIPADAPDDVRDAVLDAWRAAAVQLIGEAQLRSVEELRTTARSIRDLLDPEGAAARFDERYRRRSFRMWIDDTGTQRASMAFDDDAAAWVRTIRDTALRPRRGGPRFVDAAEAARAKQLQEDPRTNDQLFYDLIMDVLRAGALADAETVFGTRQAGVRVVITAAAQSAAHSDPGLGEAPVAGVGHCEDGGQTLPAWLVGQRACDVGEATLITDRDGNPLYLGRESRLFTPKQKMALAIRDGGCRWRGCDRPASYCEAHHIDHYVAQKGRTDIDRGILLCRFHHMNLHHHGWWITRDGLDDFLLHPPDEQGPVSLPPRLALTYAWAGIEPPSRRFRPAA